MQNEAEDAGGLTPCPAKILLRPLVRFLTGYTTSGNSKNHQASGKGWMPDGFSIPLPTIVDYMARGAFCVRALRL